jgi:hypothetical protein
LEFNVLSFFNMGEDRLVRIIISVNRSDHSENNHSERNEFLFLPCDRRAPAVIAAVKK